MVYSFRKTTLQINLIILIVLIFASDVRQTRHGWIAFRVLELLSLFFFKHYFFSNKWHWWKNSNVIYAEIVLTFQNFSGLQTKYAIVEFGNPAEAQTLLTLKQLPLFFGKQLIIKKRTVKEQAGERPKAKQTSKPRKEKTLSCQGKSSSFLAEDVLESIKLCRTVICS